MGSKGVARDTDKTTGHSTYVPRATQGPGPGCSTTVFANNQGVNRVGDLWKAHGSAPAYPGDPHPGQTTHTTDAGSSTVFADNKAVARIGDPVEGDKIAGGSGDVFAGD